MSFVERENSQRNPRETHRKSPREADRKGNIKTGEAVRRNHLNQNSGRNKTLREGAADATTSPAIGERSPSLQQLVYGEDLVLLMPKFGRFHGLGSVNF